MCTVCTAKQTGAGDTFFPFSSPSPCSPRFICSASSVVSSEHPLSKRCSTTITLWKLYSDEVNHNLGYQLAMLSLAGVRLLSFIDAVLASININNQYFATSSVYRKDCQVSRILYKAPSSHWPNCTTHWSMFIACDSCLLTNYLIMPFQPQIVSFVCFSFLDLYIFFWLAHEIQGRETSKLFSLTSHAAS